MIFLDIIDPSHPFRHQPRRPHPHIGDTITRQVHIDTIVGPDASVDTTAAGQCLTDTLAPACPDTAATAVPDTLHSALMLTDHLGAAGDGLATRLWPLAAVVAGIGLCIGLVMAYRRNQTVQAGR